MPHLPCWDQVQAQLPGSVHRAGVLQLAELAAAVLASRATLGQQHQEDCLLLMTRLLDDPSYPARRAAAHVLPAAAQLCSDQVMLLCLSCPDEEHDVGGSSSQSPCIWVLG